jgi:large subunit ribosomal protein L18
MSKTKNERRAKIKRRIRGRLSGTTERPRLTVFRSNSDIYVQLIDDLKGHTLVSASSKDKEFAGIKTNKVEQSRAVGKLVADRAKSAGINTVVFDRNGYLYHGRVKAVAEGAREEGLTF